MTEKKKVLQKYISEAGFCSRRKAQEMIQAGQVKINGKIAKLGDRAGVDDLVEIGGKRLRIEEKIYLKLNKPTGFTCSNKKFPGEKNVFDLVKTKEKLFVAGRLDKDSRGLVILTNDGDWGNNLTHPSFGHEKEYEVEINKNIAEKLLKEKFVKKGIMLDNKDKVFAKSVQKLSSGKYRLILTQGKKRQIRRMFQAVKAEVVDLKRVRINDIELGDLREGELAEINFKDKV
ncbi:MAG: pseudouridine synthase [Patescibacteria group bacterium]